MYNLWWAGRLTAGSWAASAAQAQAEQGRFQAAGLSPSLDLSLCLDLNLSLSPGLSLSLSPGLSQSPSPGLSLSLGPGLSLSLFGSSQS